MTRRRNYKIGYGKPPKHKRFKRGKSGNPKGRPKGSRNLKTDLEEELKRQVVIREDGKAKQVSKQRATVMSLFNKAMQGEPRAIRILFDLIRQLDEENATDIEAGTLSQDDLEILKDYEKLIRQQQSKEDADNEE